MEFRLPTNLQTELIAYDPQLKAMAREQTVKKVTKKSKYPLGNIPHLIPYNIIRESLQQDAIDNINANQARYRFRKFTTPVDVATPQARLITKAIIYHYEQCWYAAWLPGKDDDYVYGYAFAFKDTAAARKVLSCSMLNNTATYEEVIVGRTKFFVKRQLVTKEGIQAGMTQYNWRAEHIARYYEKAAELAPVLDEFREALKETIPVWDDHREMFARMRCKEIWEALEINKDLIPEHKRVGWKLTVDNLIEAFSKRDEIYGNMSYRDIEYASLINNLRVLNTPFFRKWMQQELNTCIQNYNDPTNREHCNVRRGFMRVLLFAQCVNYVNTIWPDCPVDYFQQHMVQLIKLQLRQHRDHEVTIQWLRQHMPVASFFKIVDKYCEGQNEDKPVTRVSYSETTGYEILWFSDWNDTLSMIARVLNNGAKLTPPKRWRLSEFHDYVQAESWKISNPNELLPQDLFPEPIKVQHNNKLWSFFQPHDTHQLAMWGKAVRNCVGSASGYAEGVRKKQHFIVLCMLDGQPHFTIQLKVSNGMMSVDQIRGLCNSILTVKHKDEYTEVFRIALQTREAALKSH
jgi:hypothetical protein